MPGHKLGRGIPADFLEPLQLLDVTEIPGTDNLHFPKEAIREAQELAAKAFGARRTFFLVNGSTCGIHAMIMTVCKPGDKLIAARDCHKSVIGGMMLAGVDPVYIKTGFNREFGISTSISPSDVERALADNPDAKGVFITRPNYYGICPDIEKIAAIVHSHNKVLLVDEAHGSHLKFSASLPSCAMDAGADICVQSAHKTLPAFTQSAYLHVGSDAIDVDKLGFNLAMLQTSSPSYILMAFLDIARAIMEQDGEGNLENLLEGIDLLGARLEKLDRSSLLKEIHLTDRRLDRTRIVIKTSGMGLTGFEVEKHLRDSFGIQVEMSDFNNIVCIATVADSVGDLLKLSDALYGITKSFNNKAPLADINIMDTKIPVQAISLKDALHLKERDILLKDAAGKISLGILTPYPPGIPIVCPGEVITDDMVEYILNIANSGGNVTGLSENGSIKVAE